MAGSRTAGITYDVNMDMKDFSVTMGKIVKSLDRLEKTTEKSSSRIAKSAERINKSFKSAANSIKLLGAGIAGLYASAKLGGLVKDTALLAARYESLGIVINKMGANAGYTAREINSVAMALQQSGIAMVESRSTIARMIQANIDLAKATDLSRLAQNAAIIGNINSSEAFGRMIYGIQSAQTEMLRTIGINVNFEQSYVRMAAALGRNVKDLDEQEKSLARVNAVLERAPDLAGVYTAAMQTTGKQLTSLGRYVDDFKVKAGQAFGPSTTVLVKTLTETLKGLSGEIDELKDSGDLAEYAMDGALGLLEAFNVILNGISIVQKAFLGLKLAAGTALEVGAQANLKLVETQIEKTKKALEPGGWKKAGFDFLFGTGDDSSTKKLLENELVLLEARRSKLNQTFSEGTRLADAAEKSVKRLDEFIGKVKKRLDGMAAQLRANKKELIDSVSDFGPEEKPEFFQEEYLLKDRILAFDSLNKARDKGVDVYRKLKEQETAQYLKELKKEIDAEDKLLKAYFDGLDENSREASAKIKEFYDGIAESIGDGLTDAILDAGNAFKNLGEIATSVLNDIAEQLIQKNITGPATTGISAFLQNLFENANGGAFVNGVQAFATGGVVSSPTIFPMANGAGLMGEAGPEGILPLRRNSAGQLGVMAEGGGGGGLTVNYSPQISAVDTQSGLQFLASHSQTITGIINKAYNDIGRRGVQR